MLTIISGTNRQHSMTRKVASIVHGYYQEWKVAAQICDLAQLPRGLFVAESYGRPPLEFSPFQEMILNTDGLVVVVPEYNGGIPGVLKYFIDLLQFPQSLRDKPACFVGVAAGVFGALRPIEQLAMVLQYRQAHLYGKRAMFMNVEKKLSADGRRVTCEFSREILEDTLRGFGEFARKLAGK